MNCREAERLISTERDEALDAGGRAALEAHTAECSHCRQMRAALSAVSAAWRSDSVEVRVPDAALEWRRVQNRIRLSEQPRPRSYVRWFGIPAAIAVAAAAVALYVGPGHFSGGTPDQTVARASASNSSSSTVVYTDDKSGWTFVWSTDANGGGQTI